MKNVILVGNPNVGKTTLFNTLTKSSEKVSNWHGVTVDVKSQKLRYEKDDIMVSDLPGLYSLDGYSYEEKIACDYLNKHKDDLIINICDANNLKRNLILTKQLLEKSYKVILAVNMINEVKDLDLDSISRELGISVFGIDARKNKSVAELKSAIIDHFLLNNDSKIPQIAEINKKIDKIDSIIESLNNNAPKNLTQKIDRIVLNKFLFLFVFLGSMLLIFYLTFGEFGELFSGFFNGIFRKGYDIASNFILSLNTSDIIKDFLIFGILNSALSVLSFFPQILLLMILISILEDMGFMSRIAFMFDGVLKKIGLSGKSLFSIMMGYGCTTTAILTTRNLDKSTIRKRTALILPFSLCSAKLPVFLTLSSIFFKKYKFLFIFCLYIISMLLIILFSSIYKKLIPDKDNYSVMELPKYRLPYLRKIVKDSMSIAFEFLYKVGTIILFASTIFWILQNFTFSFEYLSGKNFTRSMLYGLSKFLEPVFKPIGLNNASIIVLLLFGLVAKELVIVGISLINGVSGSLSAISGSLLLGSSLCKFDLFSSIIFLLFILIYSPCISAISMIRSEFNTKTAIYVFISQIAISYLICFITYRCLLYPKLIYFLIMFLVLAIAVRFMIKLFKSKHCKGNCNACRKI